MINDGRCMLFKSMHCSRMICPCVGVRYMIMKKRWFLAEPVMAGLEGAVSGFEVNPACLL